jgi:hypothetical protein
MANHCHSASARPVLSTMSDTGTRLGSSVGASDRMGIELSCPHCSENIQDKVEPGSLAVGGVLERHH